MQKWEYTFVALHDDKFVATFAGRENMELGKKPEIVDAYNKLGSDGWELISVDDSTGMAVFKRPKL